MENSKIIFKKYYDTSIIDNEKIYALHKRLFISIEDLRLASYFAHFLMTKRLHYHQWEKRGRVYERQAAFTISLVISYCRPFTNSRGLPIIPNRLMPFTSLQHKLHSKILSLRHQLYAHSDGNKYKVTPVGDTLFRASIFSSNPFMLCKSDLKHLSSMINKMLKQFRLEQQELESYIILHTKEAEGKASN